MQAILRTFLLAALAAATPAASQVIASQVPTPPPPPRQELCPLQLDIDLHELEGAAGHTIASMPAGGFLSTNTGQHVCDRARVATISFKKETDRPREVLITIDALLSSEWMRQDVDLTVSLLVNGEIKKTEEFRALTIGDPNANWAARNISFAGSSSKTRGLRFWLKRAQFNEWFAPESKPSVRVTMAVVDGGDDEEGKRAPEGTAPPAHPPVVGSEPTAAPRYIEELRELARLRDQGVLTEEEFTAKKRQLLGVDEAGRRPPSPKLVPQGSPSPPPPSSKLAASIEGTVSTQTESTTTIAWVLHITSTGPRLADAEIQFLDASGLVVTSKQERDLQLVAGAPSTFRGTTELPAEQAARVIWLGVKVTAR
jgi:hypothetical protein